MTAKGIFYVSLFASDLRRSKQFYSETLGWQLGTDESYVAGFHFGAGYLVVMADTRAPELRRYGGGMQVEVMVDDVDAEHSRLRRAGIEVGDLRDQPWGERNFQFTDPDGYVWSFGQPK